MLKASIPNKIANSLLLIIIDLDISEEFINV